MLQEVKALGGRPQALASERASQVVAGPRTLLKRVEGRDLRAFPLTPNDAYFFYDIAARGSVDDILACSVLGVSKTREILVRLLSLGLVDEQVQVQRESGTRRISAMPLARRQTPPPPPPASEKEVVELAPERRWRILQTYHRLDRVGYYELLGVSRDADRKTIRRAYFELSKIFHPDTCFRRQLGSYKRKMEVVFQRLTHAYDVLSNPHSRAAYDAQLELQAQSASR